MPDATTRRELLALAGASLFLRPLSAQEQDTNPTSDPELIVSMLE